MRPKRKKINVPKVDFDMEAIREIKNRKKKKIGKSSNRRKEVTKWNHSQLGGEF